MPRPRIVLDPGHGGYDPGARTADGRPEKETNLRVALKAEALLTQMGFDVLMTRHDDVTLDLESRCEMANEWGAAVFLSLHADATGRPAPRGHHAIHSIHSRPDEDGHRLARLLVDELDRSTGRPHLPRGDRGCWTRESQEKRGKDYYGVIRETRMPAVILERGFLTNPDDAPLLFDDEFLGLQAAGIAQAVARYFGAAEPAVGHDG